ncbi:hypothetical protein ACP6PL_04650 [Dapis sp. BLCC M126]|uniref:hypothetical protein n=1 Tax=Dapis sp. BLCC M126 TaxID=3400189 RepID=UPI003CF1055C
MGEIRKIGQDLQRIEEAIADIAKEFYSTYQGYLKALGQGMRQQLIFASYHICTQAYSETFLKLSFSQRQKMQEELREIVKIGVQELQELLEQNPESCQKSDQTSASELIMTLLSEEEEGEQEAVTQLKDKKKDIEFDSSVLFSTQTSSQTTDDGQQEVIDKTEDTRDKTEAEKVLNSPENIIDKLDNIDILIPWQENIEKQIPEILKKLSHQTNCILQKAEILPKKIPQKVLEAATKMESGDTSVGGRPNLLNLLIEAEDLDDDDDAKVTRITAINLRLSEIEFTDINTMSWRNKIRNLLGKLSQLQREYGKKKREKSIIEAELAWRSSWYED